MENTMVLDAEIIKKNIDGIMKDIEKYSPYPKKVKLVAITKYFDEQGIESVLKSGHNIIGENKGQQIRDKERYFRDKEDIEWHFIGNLQKNKIKYIIDFVELIHSINSLELAEELDKKAREKGRIIQGLIELNLSNERSKEGYNENKLNNEIAQYTKFNNLKIVGLMTMGPNTQDNEVIRKTFKKLFDLKDRYNEKYFNGELTELSMGMSGDYKIALEEGSTIIRVGTKIFEKN